MNKTLNLIFSFALVMGFSPVHAADGSKLTPTEKLNKAIELDKKSEYTKLLNDKKIDLNGKGASGMTALMTAASSGNVAATKLLLKKKVNLELKNDLGDTALAIAVSADEAEISRLLIHSGANVHIGTLGEKGDTLLITASKSNAETVKLILDKDQKLINETNSLGNTALMEAAYAGYNDVVKILVSRGADRDLKNKEGKTALDLAKESYNNDAIQILNKHK